MTEEELHKRRVAGGRIGGRIGGRAKVKKGVGVLPPEERTRRAREAANALWAQRRLKKLEDVNK